MRARIVALAVVFLVVHAVLAGLSPFVENDWEPALWAARFDYTSGVAWLGHFLVDHWTFSDLVTYALGRVGWLHLWLSPLAALALVTGMFSLAFGRLPRTGRDLFGVALGSAFFWIATMRPGVLYFHRTTAGTQLYGAALACWVLAAYRGVWQPTRWLVVPFVIGALMAGTSTRQIGIATAIAAIVMMRRQAVRPRWMKAATIALVIGALAGCADLPLLEFRRVLSRGLEQNLVLLISPLSETGKLVSIAALLALAKLVLERMWPRLAPTEEAELPPARATFHLGWTAAGLAAFGLFGPRATDAMQMPTTVVAIIGLLPYYQWLATSRPIRYLLVVLAVVTHLVAWTYGAVTLRSLHTEYRTRIAAIESTPAGEVATVPPYKMSLPDVFRTGEDWGAAAFRQLVAIEVFGLRDIEFNPSFRSLDPNPQVQIVFHSDGLTTEQLRAADAPTIWATQPVAARVQFKNLMKRLEDLDVTGFTAEIHVRNRELETFQGRPLTVAWFESGKLIAPDVTRGNKDETDRIPFSVKGESKSLFKEAYVVEGGVATRADQGRYIYIKPVTTEIQSIVLCTPTRCLLADSISPKF